MRAVFAANPDEEKDLERQMHAGICKEFQLVVL